MTKTEAIAILEVSKHMATSGRMYNQAIDMAIEALRHDVIFEQIKWERDVALQTLEEHGISFGAKKDDDIVKVVRCKDCIHKEHCHETVAHTKEHDGFREHWSESIEWCSRGKRKGGDDE